MQESLKEKTTKGLFWGGLSNGAQQLLNLIFGVFLARMLDADDYGMVGMLAIFSVIANNIQESGFTAAIVNKKDANHKDYNAVFWFSTFTGLLLYMVLFFCAPLIAFFFRQPELTSLSRYLFLSFLFTSLGTAQHAYIFRNLMVKQKAISHFVSLFISGAVGLVLAYNGMSYWGIATQTIVYNASVSVFYWFFSPWRPTFDFDFSPLKKMFGFSYKILITNIFNHLNHNILPVLLGRFYTETEVGFYTQANKWSGMGQQPILGMVSGVAQPVLANVADDRERQRRVFRKMLRFTAFVSFPAMFGLALIAKEFIIIAVTEKWLPSVAIMQPLCISGAFIPIIHIYQQLIISKGKSNIFMWNIMALGLFLLVSLLCALPYGIQTMLVVYVAITISWLFVWHFFIWREIGLSIFHALLDILPYAIIAGAIMVATYYITLSISNIYICIVSKILIAASLYVLIMWLSRSVTFRESMDYILKRKINE